MADRHGRLGHRGMSASASGASGMKEFESRFADAGGVRTHYLEAGSGPPVVLIHGGGAGADGYGNWMRTIPMLASHFRVVAVDMLGFGKTDKPDGDFVYSQAARNRHLAAFLEAAGLRGAALVGNSMGGATAIGVAVERPELVSKLVLMGSAGLATALTDALKPIIHYDFTREGMIALVRALTTERFRVDDKLITYRHTASLEPATRRAYASTMGWIKQQGGLFYADDFLRRVGVPTLIVNGKQDKVVPIPIALRFLELIPRSWGYIIPDCGHWAMLEHAEDFAETTSSFLRNTH
jgi:2-hydroxy-6-oxo-6-(2'-aminophenyl)hexa-2,4-dienoate hydrolase